uniref:Uncharacterized protein n=1 Tax=Arundo donax TaxID=35708 RepID=A0A0A8ZVG3_ARUDO
MMASINCDYRSLLTLLQPVCSLIFLGYSFTIILHTFAPL